MNINACEMTKIDCNYSTQFVRMKTAIIKKKLKNDEFDDR